MRSLLRMVFALMLAALVAGCDVAADSGDSGEEGVATPQSETPAAAEPAPAPRRCEGPASDVAVGPDGTVVTDAVPLEVLVETLDVEQDGQVVFAATPETPIQLTGCVEASYHVIYVSNDGGACSVGYGTIDAFRGDQPTVKVVASALPVSC